MDNDLDKLTQLTESLIAKDQELRESEHRLRSVLDIVPSGIMITKNQTIIYANQKMQDLTGYPPTELTGQSTRLLYSSDEDWLVMEGSADSPCRSQVDIRRKDGTGTTLYLTCMRIPHLDNEMIVSFYREEE